MPSHSNPATPYTRPASSLRSSTRATTLASLGTNNLIANLPASMRFTTPSSSAPNLSSTSEDEHTNQVGASQETSRTSPHDMDDHETDDGGPLPASPRNPFSVAQSSIPSTNLPLSAEGIRTVNHIAELVGLDQGELQKAKRLSAITGDDNRYYTLVCLGVAGMSRASGNLTPAQHAARWTATTDINAALLKICRLMIIQSDIQSYTDVSDSGDIIIGSLEQRTMAAIMGETVFWKDANLPGGSTVEMGHLYQNPAFMKAFRSQLRHTRDGLRNILLCEIGTLKGVDPSKPVPSMVTLMGSIGRHMNGQADKRPNAEIASQLTVNDHIRYAMLRLQTTDYYFLPKESGKEFRSQWTLIDAILKDHRSGRRSPGYIQAFNALITSRDGDFFNGHMKIEQVRAQMPNGLMPTEKEIEDAMEYLPDPEAMSAST